MYLSLDRLCVVCGITNVLTEHPSKRLRDLLKHPIQTQEYEQKLPLSLGAMCCYTANRLTSFLTNLKIMILI